MFTDKNPLIPIEEQEGFFESSIFLPPPYGGGPGLAPIL